MGSPVLLLMPVILKNGVAHSNALVTNIGARIIRGGGNQLTNNILALVTKRTTQRIVQASSLHRDLLKILFIKADDFSIANFREYCTVNSSGGARQSLDRVLMRTSPAPRARSSARTLYRTPDKPADCVRCRSRLPAPAPAS